MLIRNHTVIVFSNSQKNANEILDKLELFILRDGVKCVTYKRRSSDLKFENGSRVVCLSSNWRTARGYSGDVILDEFAFVPDPDKLYASVIPILSSRPYYRLIVSSTPNGDNFFKTLIYGSHYRTFNLSRVDAYYKYSVPVYSDLDGRSITPEVAYDEAPDKGAYSQAYDLSFNVGSQFAVLSVDQIANVSFSGVVTQNLTRGSDFWVVGVDVGSTTDRTVFWGLGSGFKTVSVYVTSGSMHDQVNQFFRWCNRADCIVIDTTGLGIGFYDLVRMRFRRGLVPINFSQSISYRGTRCSVPVALSLALAKNFSALSIPDNAEILCDLGGPTWSDTGRVITPHLNGGHCDYYWALALANCAGMMQKRIFNR